MQFNERRPTNDFANVKMLRQDLLICSAALESSAGSGGKSLLLRDDKFFSALYGMLQTGGSRRGPGGSHGPRGPRRPREPDDHGDNGVGSEVDSAAELQSDHEVENLMNKISSQIGAA